MHKAGIFATHGMTQECQRVGCIAGTLPSSRGGQDAFASLSALQVAYTSLTGQLLPEWGSSSSLQELSVLQIFNSSVSGTDHLNPCANFVTCSSKQVTLFVCTTVQIRLLCDAGAVASFKPVLNTIALCCSCVTL